MQKNTDFSERIMQVIDFVGDTKNEFAKKLGYERSQSIYDIVNGKSKPSFDFFEKLLNSEYSEIVNIEYIISGKGNLDKTKSKENLIKENDKINDKENDKKPNIQKTLSNKPTKEKVEYIDNVPVYYKERFTYPEDYKGIPLIPIDAMACFGNGEFQIMNYETSMYRVPKFEELNTDFMIKVKGSSMYPKYSSGDTVACKKLNLSNIFFQWNKVYVLDTEQGALIKRIKLLVSENPNYEPFELHLSQVYAVAIVIGVIRME